MRTPPRIRARTLVGLFILLLLFPRPSHSQNWQTFPRPSFPHTVRAAAVHDGELALGGNFTSIHDQPIRHVARWDGRRWQGFGSGPDVGVEAMTVFRGDLIISGRFGTLALVQKWGGSVWTTIGTFSADFPYVDSLFVTGDRLFAGGYFAQVDGQAAGGVAVWDGVAWGDLAQGPGQHVRSLGAWNGDLVAAGRFTIGGGGVADRVAVWNGATWSALGSGLSEAAEALIEFGGALWAATGANGALAEQAVQRWDGNAWSAVGHDLGTATGFWSPASAYLMPRAFAAFDGELYVGGRFSTGFTSPGNFAARWNGSSWERLDGFGGDAGDFAPSWTVNALVPLDGRLVIAGLFPDSGTRQIQNLVAWDGSGFHHVATDELGLSSVVYDLVPHQGGVLVGGRFDEAGIVRTGAVAFWNGVIWQALEASPDLRLDGQVNCLLSDAGAIFAGGDLYLPGETRARAATWDGASWTAMGSDADPTVQRLLRWDGRLLAATSDGVREWDGGAWLPYGADLPPDLWTREIVAHDATLYAGATKDISGTPRPAVYRLDGTAWTEIGGDGLHASGTLLAMTVHDGQIVVGGSIAGIGDVAAPGLATWNGSNWSALASGIDGRIDVLASGSEGLIAGGDFASLDGMALSDLAVLDPVTGWRSLGGDVSWSVHALLPRSGSTWVGGGLTSVGGRSTAGLAAWHPGPATGTDRPSSAAGPTLEIAPSPFNPSTSIHFELERAGWVRLDVYDVAGRLVRRLLDRELPAGPGSVVWRGRDDSGREVGSGVYLVRLRSRAGELTRKAVLAR